ncbi:ParA family protein [Chitinophaga sp. 212800010-3]|uniref:ParA family protein n=1 Tax=unclassified Chitinophaga TaxID=2619133 RepID=UPI002DEC9B44|nr:AAA-31 domain-containing protein [Chitinophaga sp. 212800010-3]
MSVIALAIQKGGSGKTTTAINLAAALQRAGKKVLLVDADPQANLTQALGIAEEPELHLYTALKKEIAGEEAELSQAIVTTPCGLMLVPSALELAGAELELVGMYGREQVLSWMLKPLQAQFDFILIDCPPAIGMLTVNALVASQYIIMPLQAEFLPLKGVRSFMYHFGNIKKKLNTNLEVLGIVLTKYDDRKSMNRQVRKELETTFGTTVLDTAIRSNIQLAKAQQAGMDIFSFDNTSHGAKDYHALGEEILGKLPAMGS